MDKDRRVSIETISAQFGVRMGTVHTIIREELKMRKICVKFVPRVFREDQKERRCHDNREMVELINLDPAVLDVLVTYDEGQTEEIHPQTFDDPFFWQHWYDLHALGSHWTDSQQGILCWDFKGVQKEIPRKRPSLFKSGQWHFHQDNTPVHNSILVTDYLTKMGIKTVPHPPYCPDLAPCDFWLFPKLMEKLRGSCYETIEEIKEAVTVIDTLTQEDFYEAFQKLLGLYNKCIAAGEDYFEGD